jgi:hypothetical protein
VEQPESKPMATSGAKRLYILNPKTVNNGTGSGMDFS